MAGIHDHADHEIVERILTGEEAEGISLAKLRTDLPVVWKEQRWGCVSDNATGS